MIGQLRGAPFVGEGIGYAIRRLLDTSCRECPALAGLGVTPRQRIADDVPMNCQFFGISVK